MAIAVVFVVCESLKASKAVGTGSFVLPDVADELDVVFRSLDSFFSIEER